MVDGPPELKTLRDGWRSVGVGDAITYVRHAETCERTGTLAVIGSPPNGAVVIRQDDGSHYELGLYDTAVAVDPVAR